ncbi:MAG TPA: prolyl oligopeptidase family serine peptidase [Firmicutes bacterium]|nr:prolyl oligopeptidase family serine peptidase [Bacillota bacterium]
MQGLAYLLALSLVLAGCAQGTPQGSVPPAASAETPEQQPDAAVSAGLVSGQVLEGAEGPIHYSYILPEGYDGKTDYPLVVTMPGYDRMWFGEDSAGSNLDWNGFLAWTRLEEPMIVVSAQLTDWGQRSARQAVELTEYFLQNFAVDENRVYGAGYSAGGETMSQVVSMRPDLYAAYLHGASQWDGTYEPVAENRVAVYIFMAESDEYYGSQKARDAYAGLRQAYEQTGLSEREIDQLLHLEIPEDAYFNRLGIYNYHGGGNVLFDQPAILEWITQQEKE